MSRIAADPAYALTHQAEIASILERMRRERTLATVEFGDGRAIVSCVLDVRRDAQLLVFDIGREAADNDALFSSSELAFVSEIDNIQIAFETGAAKHVQIADGPAAVVAFPSAVTRLQRRQWFRAALPVDPPIRCTVLDEHGNASPAQAIDLSCGGTAVVVDDPSFTDIAAGTSLELILSLPEIGRLDVDATLRTVRTATGTTGVPNGKLRLGFRFEDLPAKTANQIQRYVQKLETNELRVLRLRER